MKLEQGFRSASGTVLGKETFLFVRSGQEGSQVTCLELPLSPSMGLSASELREVAATGGKIGHPLLIKLCSWFGFSSDVFRKSSRSSSQESVEFKTIGIGEELPPRFPGILKLKGAPQNLDELIEFSSKLTARNVRWAVDFNGSLKTEQFLRWKTEADLSNCEWTEQPLAPGISTASLIGSSSVYFDEEMSGLDPVEFARSGARGFVLKPWRHSLSEYLRWHEWSSAHGVPYVVGSMIQSPIADELCDTLNEFASIHYQAIPEPAPVEEILASSEFLGAVGY